MTDVIERFLRYVKIDTQSSEEMTSFPSTAKQKDLGRLLAQELADFGASDVFFDEQYGYVYAKIPSTVSLNEADVQAFRGQDKVLGFIAHMDTSPETSGKDVKPSIVEGYDGGDIVLHADKHIVLSPQQFPEILDYVGKSLIVTDGTTLLGADDKAGVAEIMSMAKYLLEHPEISHGPIAIAFTPDEEIGAGVDHFDLKRFGADVAYTVDGGGIGELEYENFNAASAVAHFTGVTVHPGEAKDKMKNAALMAMEFERFLPQAEKPEHTSGYEGFYHLTQMRGDVASAELSYIIRDHDRGKFERKKEIFKETAERINDTYGIGSVEVSVVDSYYNMREMIEPDHMDLINQAKACMEELGIVPKIQPIRGGTDGARLSFMGLPCPNICTGGHNYHGPFEYVCVESMEQIVDLLVKIACK